MATYTVQSPDGKTITLEGPDGASQADVIAQAQRLYQPKAAAPKPKAAPVIRPQDAQVGLDRGSQLLEQRIKNLSPEQQSAARDMYVQRTAGLRAVAPTKRNASAPAKATVSSVRKYLPGADFLDSVSAGVARNLFGVPEQIASAVVAPIRGEDRQSVLKEMRQQTDADREKSLAGNILGSIYGAVGGGNIAGAGVRALGGRLAASGGSPIARGAGRMLEGATTLKKGQRFRNAAKIAQAGAAGGAAQALGEGSDVQTGATYGGIGAPAAVGLGKAAGYIARPAADFLRLSDAGTFLRRFTNASPEEIQRNIDAFRETGAEPTLYEVLPLDDRNRLSRQILKRTAETTERTAAATGSRLSRMGDELGRNVRQGTGDMRQQAIQAMVRDMEAASGRPSVDRGILPAGPGADASPARMRRFAKAEANARMGQYDDQTLFDTIDDLLPQNPVLREDGLVDAEISDVPVFNMIRRKAKLAFAKNSENPSGGITGRNITTLLSDLRDYSRADHTDSDVASSAVNHLEDILRERHPEFLAANDAKREAFAGRMKTKEGMAEGAATRTEPEIAKPSGETDNAYETPEGATGRMIGQANALSRDFSGTPNDVVRRAMSIATDGNVQAALRANIGDDAADALIAQARQQVEGARRLASVSREGGADDTGAGADAVVNGILALSPTSMLTTKAAAVSRLVAMSHIPQSRANQIVDLLFSGDRATTNQAVQLLGRAGPIGRQFLGDLAGSLGIGGLVGGAAAPAAGAGSDMQAPAFIPEASAEEVPVDEGTAPEIPVEEEIPVDEGTPYGRAVIEDIFPEAVVTSDHRGPDNPLYDPNSGHAGDDTVDVRPIPGMTFDEFLRTIEDEGYTIIKAYDESRAPADPRKARAWGPHWHVQIG